jgi:hypothetical protein
VQNPPLLDLKTATPEEAKAARSVLAGRFVDLVAGKLVATETVFRHHLDSDVPFIHHAGEYIAQGGGKRVRPALLLLAARLLGHDGDEEVTYGAVIEFIPTTTSSITPACAAASRPSTTCGATTSRCSWATGSTPRPCRWP